MIPVNLAPAPGRFVRDPMTGQPLKPEGEPKVLDGFWRRRLAAGDVVEVDEPAEPSTSDAGPSTEALEEAEPAADTDTGSPSGQLQEAARVEPQATAPRTRASRTET